MKLKIYDLNYSTSNGEVLHTYIIATSKKEAEFYLNKFKEEYKWNHWEFEKIEGRGYPIKKEHKERFYERLVEKYGRYYVSY